MSSDAPGLSLLGLAVDAWAKLPDQLVADLVPAQRVAEDSDLVPLGGFGNDEVVQQFPRSAEPCRAR